jgi:hypothetical protein
MAANTTSPRNGVQVAYWVTATATETVPQIFSAILGNSTGTVSATATAAILPDGPVGGCIYVLGGTGIGVSNSGNANIESGCGVYVNSSANNAVSLSGGAFIRTNGIARTNIVGNFQTSGGATITPAPVLGVSPMPDPFVTAPSPVDPGGACQNASFSGQGTYTVNPGVYCNFSLSGQARVTLNPGTYVLRNGLSMSGGSRISGSGVLLYNKSGSLGLSGGTDINLSGLTSGPLRGFVIFQDRNNTANMDLSGGATQTIAGAIYSKNGGLNYTGNGSSTGNGGVDVTLVVKTLRLTGNAYIRLPAGTAYGNSIGSTVLIN